MSGNSHVLLVDDDAGTRESLGDILRLRGFQVDVADRGRDALALLAGRRFDAAIVDIALPDMSGFELMRAIKQHTDDAEIIFITGFASLPTALQALKGDAFAYFVKPFETEQLLATLSQALEKQRLARALRESESRYRLVTETMPDGIFLLDLEGRVVFTNPAAATLTGYAEGELLGRSIFSAMRPQTTQGTDGQPPAIREGQAPIAYFEGQIERKDGTVRWVEANIAAVVRDGRVMGRLAVWRDISARKQLEEQLVQAQKMEAVGRLAGGIAHDFNNLLTVVNGRSVLLLDALEPDDPRRRHAELIAAAGERGATLTSQLLAFSRKQILQARVVDLNGILSDIKSLLGRLVRANVDLQLAMDPQCGCIKADPGQIEQVIMNLAINASDAMPDGGRLTFETAHVELPHTQTRNGPEVAAGSYVVLTATDTGGGIDRGDPAPHLRALLHHQGARQGHRPRPLHGLRDRQAERRSCRRHQRDRSRHQLQGVSAPNRGARRQAHAGPGSSGLTRRIRDAPDRGR